MNRHFEPADEDAARAHRKPIVVCVDDEPAVLTSLRRLLRCEPYELLTTDRPDRALQWVSRGGVTLLVSDQRMPGMTGTELLRQVRERSPDTIRVMLTGYPDKATLSDRRDGVIRMLLTKPWDEGGLRRSLRRLLKGDSSRGPADVRDPVLEIDCADRSPREVIAEILERASGEDNPVVILDNVMSLEDSVSGLFKCLLRSVAECGATMTILDRSGCAQAFLAGVHSTAPIQACGPAGPAPRGRRVLVVEDDEKARDFLQTVVESFGHLCDSAGSAGEAIRKMDAGAFDQVLLDLELPDADGLAVVRHVRERCGNAEVVPISARLDACHAEIYERFGIRRGLRKPYRFEEIVQVLRGEG